MMKRIFLILTVLLFLVLKINAQNDPPTITICGDQYICTDDLSYNLCVYITVDPSFVGTIDEFVIDWNDGTPNQTITGSLNPDTIYHTYDLTDFQGDICEYEIDYGIDLLTYETGGSAPLYNASKVWFRKSPTANFSYTQKVCVGDDVNFNSSSCPTDFLEYLWDFGGGTTLTTEDATHQFLSSGFYDITLTVENNCGSDVIIQTIEVINPAEANAVPLPGYVDESQIPFIVCMDSYPGSVTVPLDGDSLSLYGNIYEWQSLFNILDAAYILPPDYPNPNDQTPNIPDISVTFSDTGMFQIILEVDNECNQPDFDTLFFHVLTGEGLGDLNQEDACLELIYDPDPMNLHPNAICTINGIVQTSFPVTLPVGDYEVICTLTNECGTQIEIDNFTVFEAEDVTILSPTSDTVCINTDSIQIFYEPFGGTWTGDNLVFYGDSVFFHPTEIGVFEITYSKGPPGTECIDSDTITITVIGSNISANDYEVCSTSSPFQMIVDNPGGTGIFTSTDCPLCIQGDTFIISEMVVLGLTVVEINYEGSSSGGCDGNNTFTVTLDDPNAMFVVEETFCLGDQIPIDISNTNGDLDWMINGLSEGPPPYSSTTLGAGSHIIKLTATAGDCDTMFTDTITIFSVPTDVSFTVDTLEGCADLEVTLTNTTMPFDNEAYEWYLGDSLISTAIQPGTFTLGPGFSDTTYTFTLNAGNSCEGAEATQDVIVFPRPVPLFEPMQNNYCSGDTVTFANVSFGGPMSSWFWDYGNGTTSTDSIPLQIIYFTGDVPTVYTISLTATNECGTETFTYELTVNPTNVEAFFNIDPVEGCVGVPICLTNLSTIGASLLWDFGDGNTSTEANPCHTYANSGSYIITLKAFGCGFDSIQFEVVIHPMPLASFLNNTITCPGTTVSFTNNSLLAQNFFWEFGDGITSTLNNPDHIYTASGVYEVKLLATTTEGCVDSSFSTITVLVPPSASFTVSTDSVCVADNITLTNTSSPSPLTCFWDFGDGNFSNDCVVNHSFDTSGNFMVTLVVTDGDGCRDTTQQLVNVTANPIAAFDFTKNGECTPVEVIFQNQSSMGESYIWDFGDGMMSTETTPSHTYSDSGNYVVTLTTISGVCSNSTTREVDIFKKPDIEIITPLGQTGCADFTATFAVTPVANNFKLSWDFGDGNFSFEENPENLFNTPGNYNVQLIVEDTLQNFCSDTATIFLEVFEPVDGTITTVDNLCYGDSVGIIEIVVENGTPEYQYDWSNGGDSTIISNLPAGDYTFTVTDSNGCNWIETETIYQPNSPLSLAILQQELVTCYGGDDGSIFITGNGGTENYDYLWENGSTDSFLVSVSAGDYNITITDVNDCILEDIVTVQQNDSISYNANVVNISCFGFVDGQISLDSLNGGVAPYFINLDTLSGTAFTGLEMGNYSLMIIDAEGCMQNFVTTIFEPTEVSIELNEDSVEIFLGETFSIESNYNVANPTFYWTPIEYLDCDSCSNPIAAPHNDVTYEVVVIDENGCKAADTIFIAVEQERGIAIPTIFTPNNDGQNDKFTLLGNNPAVVIVEEFKVFDRHGGVMFEARNFELNDPLYGWDGKFRNLYVQSGSYTYQAIVKYVDEKKELFKGSVMLSR